MQVGIKLRCQVSSNVAASLKKHRAEEDRYRKASFTQRRGPERRLRPILYKCKSAHRPGGPGFLPGLQTRVVASMRRQSKRLST